MNATKILSELCALDFDAIEAYEAAIERVEHAEYTSRMQQFKEDHVRHTEILNRILRARGADPVEGPDLKRLLTKGKVVIADLMGDKAILSAMVANEKVTTEAYDKAHKSDELTPDEKQQLALHYQDEQKHKEWFEQAVENHPS